MVNESQVRAAACSHGPVTDLPVKWVVHESTSPTSGVVETCPSPRGIAAGSIGFELGGEVVPVLLAGAGVADDVDGVVVEDVDVDDVVVEEVEEVGVVVEELDVERPPAFKLASDEHDVHSIATITATGTNRLARARRTVRMPAR